MKVYGSDLFESLKNDDGEDVWFLVDEYFVELQEPNPYQPPITAETEIDKEHFKGILAATAKRKAQEEEKNKPIGQIALIEASGDENPSAITNNNGVSTAEITETTEVESSAFGLAVQAVVKATKEELHAYLADNAFAIGTTGTGAFLTVLEKTLVAGIGQSTNTVLKRLADTLEEISEDTTQDFLDQYGLTTDVEVNKNRNTCQVHLLKKRFNQYKQESN
ncbi:hypothetical protein [Brasilonema sp. UFV-L1]|uniref:hypothetical protein n=1 Tax=Brasilonema sp. UFV-L1 TaxID=2234130 RepID=UPI00145D3FCB|nr:hypothetical protein [Brasilonema sp. UFV-L1]NMG10359.1 hypothetical protein [Brasilonema sp. UFV-L1]